MKLPPRFGTNTLLLAVAAVAVVVAAIAQPILKRRRAIQELRAEQVHVTTSVDRPSALGSVSWFDVLFDRPICSSILIQPVGSSHFRVFGDDLTFDETSTAVERLRKRLSDQLGTDRIIFVQHGDFSAETTLQLWDLCAQHETATNTCGIEYFPASAIIGGGAQVDAAEPSDARESPN